ncbi:DUF58 domain-containing protein [Bombella sp. TMW 2.2559]|uniref:DUF58 domain-containing protein n=1 Tax=Bombella dulcis TaxID=2967339 RepID=A0ABT3WEB3_9PROT|nr:DUF58 domain-containing protein [Bombella dulcis]MCX5616699.1 DUF58 domain-containing protein [Bombella dulcis]
MARLPSFLQRLFSPRREHGATPRPVPLPELILSARGLARQLRSGPHGNRRAGDGHEFWQFRPHQPTEPASLIDWKQSARSPEPDLLWVREQEQNTPRSLFIWVDPSASMRWQSSESLPSKYDTALSDALALGQAALLGGETVGLPGSRLRFSGHQALPRLAHALTRLPPDTTLPSFAGVPPHAALLLVSDFLWDDGIMQHYLARLTTHPGRTALLAVLDPQEHHLPFSGSVQFTSCENEPDLTLPATESLHAAYQARLTAHFSQLRTAGRGQKPFFRFHVTDQPALPVLADCHHFLRGRT